MSDPSTMTVTLTLPRFVAERLRAMCHARRMTASLLIESWVEERDDRGRPKKRRGLFDEVMGGIFGDD